MTNQIFLNSDSEQQCVKEKYIIFADISELKLDSSDSIIGYARQMLMEELGDEVEIDQVKVKMPSLPKRGVSRLRRRSPQARLLVTTKF
jgi:hypothetical protein